MTTRAIFLDFDGVLHPASDVVDYDTSGMPLKQFAAERNLLRWLPHLHELLAGHEDVLVIVHSGWRTRCQDYELREFLGPLAPWFAGSAPVGARYRSIERVVESAGINEYLVLDDAHFEFPEDYAPLVVCDPARGVSQPEVIEKIAHWLRTTAA